MFNCISFSTRFSITQLNGGQLFNFLGFYVVIIIFLRPRLSIRASFRVGLGGIIFRLIFWKGVCGLLLDHRKRVICRCVIISAFRIVELMCRSFYSTCFFIHSNIVLFLLYLIDTFSHLITSYLINCYIRMLSFVFMILFGYIFLSFLLIVLGKMLI